MTPRLFDPKAPIPRTAALAFSGATVGIAGGAWCLLSYGGLVPDVFLASPTDVLNAAVRRLSDGSLLHHVGASCVVIYLGFVLSSLIAVPIGLVAGSFRAAAAMVGPVTSFMRYLPVGALVPLTILWIGLGLDQKIAVIFLGTAFQQIIMISDVVEAVPKDLIDVSYTLGASRRQVLWRVIVPAALPGILDTLRVNMGVAWTYLVVAELVAANSGLGFMIINAMRGLAVDDIFLGIFVIGLLGLGTDVLMRQARRLLLPWTRAL